MGIGGAATEHMEIFHDKYIVMHKGTVGDMTADGGKKQPAVGVGTDSKGHFGNTCFISDSKGGMRGQDGKVYMFDQWAVPDNQFCIYARFG